MRAKTKQGERLKRLAQSYAQAYANYSHLDEYSRPQRPSIIKTYRAARTRLEKAIDELTSVVLTPRAVSEIDF